MCLTSFQLGLKALCVCECVNRAVVLCSGVYPPPPGTVVVCLSFSPTPVSRVAMKALPNQTSGGISDYDDCYGFRDRKLIHPERGSHSISILGLFPSHQREASKTGDKPAHACWC